MNWDRAIQFIDRVDATFLANAKGVPLKDIEAAEAGCRVRLPRAYRQFLLLMGSDSGEFQAISATQTTSFYEVLALLPDDDYPVERYFRVSFASEDAQVSPPDYFLDLAHGDDEDAPLVAFEGGGHFDPRDVMQTGFSFGEQVTDRIFRHFEFGRRAERERVFVLEVEPRDAPEHMRVAIDLLTRMGFGLALAPLPRLACMSRPGASSIVAIREPNRLLKINVGCESRSELLRLVDQLLVGLEGAELVPLEDR